MARRSRRRETICFKADADLVEAMRGIPNRSEFIREAILAALDGACPVCGGTGTLTAAQRLHWRAFSRRHTVEPCETCHTPHLVCHAGPDEPEAAPGVHEEQP